MFEISCRATFLGRNCVGVVPSPVLQGLTHTGNIGRELPSGERLRKARPGIFYWNPHGVILGWGRGLLFNECRFAEAVHVSQFHVFCIPNSAQSMS